MAVGNRDLSSLVLLMRAGADVTLSFHLNQQPLGSDEGAKAGVTRLVLSDAAKTPLVVANLSSPITFTLRSPQSGPSDKAACKYWCEGDRLQIGISAAGCT